jgi:putative Mg2+ transporter-C (MgtC) family protein
MAAIQYIIDDYSWLQYGEFALRFLVACICGATIGFERSMRLKEAGVRTHLIVCCAAALVVIVSKYGFSDLGSETASALAGVRTADPARIAAQVISGVSFLGAGVIFHNGNAIKGLTTAAGLWATAGIGLALGSGMYYIGIFTTVVLLLIQICLFKFRGGMDSVSTTQLRFVVRNSASVNEALNRYIASKNAEILESKIKIDEEGYANYSITLKSNRAITLDDLNIFLGSLEGVKSASCSSIN